VKETVRNEEHGDGEATEDEDLGTPPAILDAGAKVLAVLDANEAEGEDGVEDGQGEHHPGDGVVSRKAVPLRTVVEVERVRGELGEGVVEPAGLQCPGAQGRAEKEDGIGGAGGNRGSGLDGGVAEVAGGVGEAAHQVGGQAGDNPTHRTPSDSHKDAAQKSWSQLKQNTFTAQEGGWRTEEDKAEKGNEIGWVQFPR